MPEDHYGHSHQPNRELVVLQGRIVAMADFPNHIEIVISHDNKLLRTTMMTTATKRPAAGYTKKIDPDFNKELDLVVPDKVHNKRHLVGSFMEVSPGDYISEGVVQLDNGTVLRQKFIMSKMQRDFVETNRQQEDSQFIIHFKGTCLVNFKKYLIVANVSCDDDIHYPH